MEFSQALKFCVCFHYLQSGLIEISLEDGNANEHHSESRSMAGLTHVEAWHESNL